jgi:hypothetical protein
VRDCNESLTKSLVEEVKSSHGRISNGSEKMGGVESGGVEWSGVGWREMR